MPSAQSPLAFQSLEHHPSTTMSNILASSSKAPTNMLSMTARMVSRRPFRRSMAAFKKRTAQISSNAAPPIFLLPWLQSSSTGRLPSRTAAKSPVNISKRSLFVQTESTPNPDSIKFLPGRHLQTNKSTSTHEFLTATSALPSPLASSLFAIDGIKSIFFGPDFITVNKETEANWATMKPEVYSIIIEHFTSGQPLFRATAEGEGAVDQGPEDTRILDTDSEAVAMIKELLDTRVRPSIQEDGGDLEFKGFDEGTGIVQLSLKGSCRGCDSSTVTLKSGIERMLMHYIPEVKSVEQVLGDEEKVAVDEFAKFEARLRSEGKSVHV